jgi:hypothetical protein
MVGKLTLRVLDSLPLDVYDWFWMHNTWFLWFLLPILIVGLVVIGLLARSGTRMLRAYPKHWAAIVWFITTFLAIIVVGIILYRLLVMALMIVVYRLVGLS